MSAAIFSGSTVKILKSILDINGNAQVLSGTVNPSSVATSAPKGSLYLNTSTAVIYRKNDNGLSTNWIDIAVPNPTPSYRETTGNDTITYGDKTILASAGGANAQLVLPDPAGFSGYTFRIMRTDSDPAHTLTIATSSAETIDDYGVSGLTLILSTQGEWVDLTSTSLGWTVTGSSIPSRLLSFTPTGGFVTNSTWTGRWERIGDLLHVKFKVAFSGAPGASTLYINLPFSLTMDSAKILSASDAVGMAVADIGANSYPLTLQKDFLASTKVGGAYYSSSPDILTTVSNTAPAAIGNGSSIYGFFKVPITGWRS